MPGRAQMPPRHVDGLEIGSPSSLVQQRNKPIVQGGEERSIRKIGPFLPGWRPLNPLRSGGLAWGGAVGEGGAGLQGPGCVAPVQNRELRGSDSGEQGGGGGGAGLGGALGFAEHQVVEAA